jgi:hypothetical protein
VPLPIDPERKSQYAGSVRRLVHDGLDSPLANLFVHVAVIPPPNAEVADRARSATEAFLYRRLETLAETAGRFRLNAELPIPFDGWGKSRIAIELDGGQHLGDTDAYREIVARMLCSRRTAIWSSGSLPKTLANISIKFWMQSCGLCHIKTPEPEMTTPRNAHVSQMTPVPGRAAG